MTISEQFKDFWGTYGQFIGLFAGGFVGAYAKVISDKEKRNMTRNTDTPTYKMPPRISCDEQKRTNQVKSSHNYGLYPITHITTLWTIIVKTHLLFFILM